MTQGMGRSARRFLAAVSVTVFVAALIPFSNASLARATTDATVRASEYALVRVAPGAARAVAASAAAAGATDVQALDSLDLVTARLNRGALAGLAQSNLVRTIAADTLVTATGDGKNRKDLDSVGHPTGVNSVGVAASNAPAAWSVTTGRGVTVALMDTGVAAVPGLDGSVLVRLDFVDDGDESLDPGGHGTHLAGLIAGHSSDFRGVAPDAKLVSLRVLDRHGKGFLRNVLAAFDWLLKNRHAYGIRVLNLGLGAPQTTSYNNDVLAAAVEEAWFAGIAVVAAAGNDGPAGGTITTPGADPFVITAGSLDDQGTAAPSDDRVSDFSGRGPTRDGFTKPDVLAPGRKVVSLRAAGSQLELDRPDRILKDKNGEQTTYLTLSGTSVASAITSGGAALVFSARPGATPTQVKGALVAGGRHVSGTRTPALDVARSLSAHGAADANFKPSATLIKFLAANGVNVTKSSGISWEGISWEGISWEGISWEGIAWEIIR